MESLLFDSVAVRIRSRSFAFVHIHSYSAPDYFRETEIPANDVANDVPKQSTVCPWSQQRIGVSGSVCHIDDDNNDDVDDVNYDDNDDDNNDDDGDNNACLYNPCLCPFSLSQIRTSLKRPRRKEKATPKMDVDTAVDTIMVSFILVQLVSSLSFVSFLYLFFFASFSSF